MEKETKKETKEEDAQVLVVKELPKQDITKIIGEDGKTYELVTIEDAVTEILKKVRENNEILGS